MTHHDVFRFQITMDKIWLFKSNKRLQNLLQIVSDPVQRQSSLSLWYDIVQWLGKKLKNDTQEVLEDKVILHLYQILLFKLRSFRILK